MAELFALAPENIEETSRLREDLGLDSVDGADLTAKLQSEHGVRLNAASLRGVKTVGDLVTAFETAQSTAQPR